MQRASLTKSQRFERFLLRLIQYEGADRGHTFPIRLFLWILKQFSKAFKGIAVLRAWLYESGLKVRYPLGCQVISVGNVTVGGTGKTPVVEILAKTLTEQGRKVAILSRGYKSKKKSATERTPRVVSDGKSILLGSEFAGDEPFMLASNLPGVVVLVDKNRVKSGRYAISKFGCDVLILDDGFQYMKLKHTHEIVLVDKTNPFGNGYLLPRGILREPADHISRADFIFITKSDGNTDALRTRLRKMNKRAEIIECRHRPCYFKNAFGDDIIELSAVSGMKVISLTGIAAPLGFENSIRRMGGRILSCERFSDHYRYNSQDIIEIINMAAEQGADAILTTEKDAVRLPHIEKPKVKIYYMRMDIEIIKGYNNFTEYVKKICFQ